MRSFLTTLTLFNQIIHKKNPAEYSAGSFYILIKDRRQRERRNRRKNLWGNVSLLRGWQQHPRIDVVNYIISTTQKLIRLFYKFSKWKIKQKKRSSEQIVSHL